MANFRFFNIGQANAEIDRLEAEALKLKQDFATASQDETAKLAQINADLVTARQTIATLTTQLDAANQTIKDREAASSPSAQALAIVAAQGVPPVPQNPGSSKSTEELWNEFRAISDPRERARFYQSHTQLWPNSGK
jgi:hypothetical protein